MPPTPNPVDPQISPPEPDATVSNGAYQGGWVHQSARWLLIACAVPLLFCFARWLVSQQAGFLELVAAVVLLLSLLTSRGPAVFRIALLAAMTFNVFSSAINPNDYFNHRREALVTSAIYVLLGCLFTATLFEITAWVKSSKRSAVLKTIAWSLLAIPVLVYIVGLPLIQSVWDAFDVDEKKLALRDPNWNVVNEMAFRAAKFFVFAVFTYLGACLGSFLNVAAYCLPRGEAIGIRDSKCPRCDTKISRIDNLPIFSYVNLGAACRNCQQGIPVRYLIVELVVAAIFGSLFLYQLVTGSANVPGISIIHTGILWIILYPKWPVIGLYLYHTFWMSTIVVFGLIESDRQSLNTRQTVLIGSLFLLSAAIYLPLQPIGLFEHLPSRWLPLSGWNEQLVKLVVGGGLGTAIGLAISFVQKNPHRGVFVTAFLLSGLVVGWQALLQISVIFVILAGIGWLAGGKFPFFRRWTTARPTSLLWLSIFVHHPFWKWIDSLWRLS